jgi:hypothetical protein
MNEDDEADIHAAVNDALNELAAHLGGSSDTGGPVENATQIKGRGDLGVLLTDASNRVLGRVWVAFGAAVNAPSPASRDSGKVHVQAEVCSEVVDPPVSVQEWATGR